MKQSKITKGIFAIVFLLAMAVGLFATPFTAVAGGIALANMLPVPIAYPENYLQQNLAAMFGVNPNEVQSSTLRRCIPFGAGTPTGLYKVKFNMTQSDDKSDFLLDQNDVFVATSIRIGIAVRETAKPSQFITETYANPITLGAAGANVADVTDFQALWNGEFTIKTGQTVTRRFRTQDCYFVPETQQSAVTNRVQRSPKDGFKHFSPRYIFTGGGDQFINVEFVTDGLDSFAAVASGFQTLLIVEVDGYNVYNMNPNNAGANALLSKGYV